MSGARTFEARVADIEIAIASAASGDFDARLEIQTDDELSSIESSINVMLGSLKALFDENRRKNEELERSLATIREQREAIRELSTPTIEVWDDVLVLPILGHVDAARCADLMSSLLSAIASTRAKFIILDLTGVESVAVEAADGLVRVARSAGLLGARCVITGLSAPIARILVDLDIPLHGLRIQRNLKTGLREAIRFLEK